MNLFIIKLEEKYKAFPRITYYKFEMNDILFDTDEITMASMFNSIEWCENLKTQIETDYDYQVEILNFEFKK